MPPALSDRIMDSIPTSSKTPLAIWASAVDRNVETEIKSEGFIVVPRVEQVLTSDRLLRKTSPILAPTGGAVDLSEFHTDVPLPGRLWPCGVRGMLSAPRRERHVCDPRRRSGLQRARPCPAVFLSVIAIVRWIQRGRIESYSSNELMPNWLPRWMGAVFGVCSPDDSRARRSTVSGVTVWGWLFVGCIAIWLFTKAR